MGTSWPCEKKCAKSGPCPIDWSHVGGDLCLAPDWYKVPACPLLSSFRGWTDELKENFAKKCAVDWACAEGATQGYESCALDLSSCPRYWVDKDGMCTPPADSQGKCAQQVDTRSM